MRTLTFGWLPEIRLYEGTSFQIKPLMSEPAQFNYIINSVRTKDGWFYPPLEPEYVAMPGNTQPLLYSDWFALPETHRLSIDGDDPELEELAGFVIETLGTLKGMQLLPEGWGHFYRTPVKLQLLGDIQYARPAAVVRVIDRAIAFWRSNATARNTFYGAVHWHLFGRSYEHPFEQFGAAYAVLDTCWAAHLHLNPMRRRVTHAERVPTLCNFYDVAVPSWAAVTGGRSQLSELRNAYFHESRWGDRPIGFGHPRELPGIHFSLYHLNTRLILAMLGERTDYTRTVSTEQSWVYE